MTHTHLSISCLLAIFMTAGIANGQTQNTEQNADTTAVVSSPETGADTAFRPSTHIDTALNPATGVDTALNPATRADTVSGATTRTDTAAGKTSRYIRHEFSVSGAAGLSVINYSLAKNGARSDGPSGMAGTLGIGYTWNINENFGLVTGLEVSTFGGKASYDAVSGEKEYGTGDDRFRFSYSMTKYVEEQTATMLSIPAMVQYSAPLSDPVTFYLAAGFKFGLPVKAQATIFPGTLNTTGYYYFENRTYFDDLPQYGFASSTPATVTSDVAMKISAAMSIESGVRFSLTNSIRAYTGAYIDYSLNNIRSKAEDEILVSYNEPNPSVFTYKSVLNTTLADKVRLFAVGVKLKISFGWN
jgi:hypothetical protein